MRRVFVVLLALAAVLSLASAGGAKVLRVGSYRGIRGQYSSIQAAVKAARAGDWILVGPGDYKTKPSSIRTPKGAPDFPAGVLITTRNLHIRGMNRNKVIVDGTRPGSAVCSQRASAQNFGLKGTAAAQGYAVISAASKPSGLNGLMVWKAPNVSIENLTACNFLGGSRDAGNGIWWNGGANTGKVGGHGFLGDYLSATTTFFKNESSAATYGIFTSNWSGGTLDQLYASNFNDSGFYIGACRQICDQTMDHAHGQYNALGYSGSNSGGRLVIENSEFDHNQDGFDTNSQNGDEPSPQNGACPHNGVSPITHTHSCWVFIHNYVHDNNNPNVPSAGGGCGGAGGHRDVGLRWAQRHGDGQPLRQQRRLGGDHRQLSGQRQAVHWRHGELTPARQGELPVRRVERCSHSQHLHPQRQIRKSDQRRLRAAELRETSE